MGSFNVACSISHLSIDCGDPTVFIPLTTNQYKEYSIGDTNHLLIASECFYEPLTLPIFGKYDDYGRIAPYKDKNTEFLENLGIKIDCLIDPMGEKDKAEIGSGMFIHGKIYDVVRDKCSSIDDGGGKWSSRKSIEKEYEEFVKDIKEAKKKANMHGPVSPDTASLSLWLAGSDHKTFNFRRWRKFRKIYNLHLIEKKILKKELIEFIMFIRGMYSINRFFFPAMNGWQFGNPFATKFVDQVALKISREKIKEFHEM